MRDPAGFTTHYTYDAIGNLHTVQLPSGGKITQNFDARSRLRTVRDPLGYQIAFDYNTEDQLTMITTPAGRTLYTYVAGQLTSITNPQNNTVKYDYDPTGRLATVTEPDGAVTSYEYNAAGNLSAVVNPLDQRVEFAYDALGRLVAETRYIAVAGTRQMSRSQEETPVNRQGRTKHHFMWILVGMMVLSVVVIAFAKVMNTSHRNKQEEDS